MRERERWTEGKSERETKEREKERWRRGKRGWTDSANNALVTQKKGRSIIASPRGRYFSNRTRPLIGGQIKEAPLRKKTSSPPASFPPAAHLPRQYIQELPRDSSNDPYASFFPGSRFFLMILLP